MTKTTEINIAEINIVPCPDGAYIVKQTFNGEPTCCPPQKYADIEHMEYAVNVARYVGELFGYTVKITGGYDNDDF